jgi:hypothetical protein
VEGYESAAAEARETSRIEEFTEREEAAAALTAVSDAMEAIPAVTLTGHGLKARVVREWHYPCLWQGGGEEDGNEWCRLLRAATDALLSLGGLRTMAKPLTPEAIAKWRFCREPDRTGSYDPR